MVTLTKRPKAVPDWDKPVPFGIVVRMACLSDNLDEASYVKALKQAIRESINPMEDWLNERGPFELYDDRVWDAIREVMEEN